jgi:hypothetical protein
MAAPAGVVAVARPAEAVEHLPGVRMLRTPSSRLVKCSSPLT